MALLGHRDVLSMFYVMGRVVEFVFMVHGEHIHYIGRSMEKSLMVLVC